MLSLNKIYQKDALEGLRHVDDGSVDLVITDPPYNIASKSKKTMQSGQWVSTFKAWGAWDVYHPFDYDLLMLRIISECYRVLKNGGAMYMFTAEEQNGYFIKKATERGLCHRNQLILVSKSPLPSLHKSNWRRAFQTCMYLSKGSPKTFNFLSQQECVNTFFYAVRNKQTNHPTEKSIEFIQRLVQVSSNKGELVLDPFMGSGTTAVASAKLGRDFLGFEVNPDYVKMARKRLRGVT